MVVQPFRAAHFFEGLLELGVFCCAGGVLFRILAEKKIVIESRVSGCEKRTYFIWFNPISSVHVAAKVGEVLI